ncbi:hypothetical protein BG004_002116, partial [Podila humilis]
QNLSPYSSETSAGTGVDQVVTRKPRDSTYMAAQYIYAIWLVIMIIKAVIGFRANMKFNIRWMGKYNILLCLDTIFECVLTTLGAMFQDMSHLDEGGMIRRYCTTYLVLVIQVYGFFCCWLHLRWVLAEMPQLLTPTMPRESLLGLMFPTAASSRATTTTTAAAGLGTGGAVVASSESTTPGTATTVQTTIVSPSDLEAGTVVTTSSSESPSS